MRGLPEGANVTGASRFSDKSADARSFSTSVGLWVVRFDWLAVGDWLAGDGGIGSLGFGRIGRIGFCG